MRAVIVLALGLVAGCSAATTYYRPGSTQADFTWDQAQCQYEAAAATPLALGQRDWVAASIGAGMREAELRDLCLKARGYTLRRG